MIVPAVTAAAFTATAFAHSLLGIGDASVLQTLPTTATGVGQTRLIPASAGLPATARRFDPLQSGPNTAPSKPA